jgi:hypothetical protein
MDTAYLSNVTACYSEVKSFVELFLGKFIAHPPALFGRLRLARPLRKPSPFDYKQIKKELSKAGQRTSALVPIDRPRVEAEALGLFL